MKIAKVKVIVVGKGSVVVRVDTDEGITGWGECSPMNPPLVAQAVVETLAPQVLGMDPFDLEKITERLIVKNYKLRGRLYSIAISGLEIALWDILGKSLGVPVYRLLGGEYRKRIRMYASFKRKGESPLEVARRAAAFVEQGFTAIKVREIGVRWGFDSLPDDALETVKETRAAIGDKIDLMIDANSAYSVPRAIQLGRRLEQYNVFHFEEPVPEHDIDALAKVSQALDVPVAGGEQFHTRYEFKELVARDAVDIIQPDVTKAGGLLECKKIAAIADAFGKIVTPHNTQPAIGTAAALHFVASTPSCRYPLELGVDKHPTAHLLLKEPLRMVDGHMEPPRLPGLGVEIDEASIEKHGQVFG